ncbi:MAG TPA: hypothetical protein VNO70_04415 [Blastocatellia bacterium]|nr:hypothetical protein [Blastocatellia bacterium]
MRKGRLNRQLMRLRKRHDDPETTRRYTPQDEQTLMRGTGNGAGIIRPSTGDLRAPAGFNEEKEESQPNKIIFVIVGLALTFIAIIAYFVAQMPKKD